MNTDRLAPPSPTASRVVGILWPALAYGLGGLLLNLVLLVVLLFQVPYAGLGPAAAHLGGSGPGAILVLLLVALQYLPMLVATVVLGLLMPLCYLVAALLAARTAARRSRPRDGRDSGAGAAPSSPNSAAPSPKRGWGIWVLVVVNLLVFAVLLQGVR